MDEQEVAVGRASFDIGTDEIEATGQIGIREAPGGWQIVRLAEVAGIRYGLGQPPAFESTGIPMIRATDIKGGSIISKTVMRVRQDAIPTAKNAFLTAGDIIVVRSGAYTGDVAMYDGRWNEAIVGYDLVVSPDREIMDPAFLAEYLLGPMAQGYFMSQRGRSAQPHLNAQQLGNTLIPVPPIFEQRAIAAVLQVIRDAIQVRRREENLERERKATLLQHLFTYGMQGSAGATKETPFGHIPESWHIMLLESCAFVQTGVTKGRDLVGHNTVTRPYLRVANVQDGYLDLSEMKEIELLATEVDRYLLQSGDVVMTEGGDFDKLGRGFIWQGQIPNCVHQNHIFAVRVNRNLVLPQFFAYLIQSSYGKAYFLSVAHRTTNLASINSTKLKALPTLLPPLAEQQEIVTVLDACDTKLSALEQETRLLEELFRVLLEELMTGRLSTVPLMAVKVAHE